jgi:hypothetical protein
VRELRQWRIRKREDLGTAGNPLKKPEKSIAIKNPDLAFAAGQLPGLDINIKLKG